MTVIRKHPNYRFIGEVPGGGSGSGSWEGIVSDVGSLPGSAPEDTIYFVTSENAWYVYNSGPGWAEAVKIPRKKVEDRNITSTELSNKYLILSEAPMDKPSVELRAFNTDQDNGDDFSVTADDGGKRLSWLGLGLDGQLELNDRVHITYNY